MTKRTTPGFAHDGPKAMLINGYSASGGDALPYFFRENGLGPLIGTRTWGGLIGLSGNPPLMDGGSVQIPTFRIYDQSGNPFLWATALSRWDYHPGGAPWTALKLRGARGVVSPRDLTQPRRSTWRSSVAVWPVAWSRSP